MYSNKRIKEISDFYFSSNLFETCKKFNIKESTVKRIIGSKRIPANKIDKEISIPTCTNLNGFTYEEIINMILSNICEIANDTQCFSFTKGEVFKSAFSLLKNLSVNNVSEKSEKLLEILELKQDKMNDKCYFYLDIIETFLFSISKKIGGKRFE